MTTVAELQQLRDHALADPAREAVYLRALLKATLYAHVPVSDDSGRMRLLMFTRPDGLTVIPLFTELREAQAAARSAARVISASGRELLEATRGATLMLDPNDISMTLYPEEVIALLDEGRAAPAPVAFDGPALDLMEAEPADAWLLDTLSEALKSVRDVRRVHLVAARPVGTEDADRLLVVVAVDGANTERTARAIGLALYASGQSPRLPVDLSTYEPDGPLADSQVAELPEAWTREVRSLKSSPRG